MTKWLSSIQLCVGSSGKVQLQVTNAKELNRCLFLASKDDRPDPGFRIYHLDKDTGQQTVVPPNTTLGQFLDSLNRKKSIEPKNRDSIEALSPTESPTEPNVVVEKSDYDETT
jgi:hypothetical protein